MEEVGDDEDNHNEYVSFTTYCRKWKKDYPQLKVSRPVEDICQYCYVFAHRHRYLANHSLTDTCIEFDDDGDPVTVMRPAGDAETAIANNKVTTTTNNNHIIITNYE